MMSSVPQLQELFQAPLAAQPGWGCPGRAGQEQWSASAGCTRQQRSDPHHLLVCRLLDISDSTLCYSIWISLLVTAACPDEWHASHEVSGAQARAMDSI